MRTKRTAGSQDPPSWRSRRRGTQRADLRSTLLRVRDPSDHRILRAAAARLPEIMGQHRRDPLASMPSMMSNARSFARGISRVSIIASNEKNATMSRSRSCAESSRACRSPACARSTDRRPRSARARPRCRSTTGGTPARRPGSSRSARASPGDRRGDLGFRRVLVSEQRLIRPTAAAAPAPGFLNAFASFRRDPAEQSLPVLPSFLRQFVNRRRRRACRLRLVDRDRHAARQARRPQFDHLDRALRPLPGPRPRHLLCSRARLRVRLASRRCRFGPSP